MSIINELYDQLPRKPLDLEQVPGAFHYVSSIRRAFQPAFTEDLLMVADLACRCREQDAFAQGLRMGARLTVALSPAPGPTAPDSRHSSSAGQSAGRQR